MNDDRAQSVGISLGSAESRAATRAMLEAQKEGVRRFQIVHSVPRPHQDNSRPHIGDWQQWTEGGFMRLIYVSSGTDEEALRRLFATP